MATNNAVNLKSSGIASYNGSGTFSALANPLTVANGGTGVSSNTAYAILCGGTTATDPIQSISGVGTAGQNLVSNGAGALPTFQTKNGYAVTFRGDGNLFTVVDATTYYFAIDGTSDVPNSTLTTNKRFYAPRAGTITKCYARSTFTNGTAETSTFYIRINDTTDTVISSSVAFNSTPATFSNSGLSISLNAGDFVSIKWISPTWVTNPGNPFFVFSVFIE